MLPPGDLDNAFADINVAIKLNPKLAESWANQALVYEKKGEMAKAAKSYKEAKRLDPNYKPAIDGLARTGGAA
jgi:Tfp pilus assembly protein PilF